MPWSPERTRAALLLLSLATAWLLWSGLYKPLLLGLGAFSCVVSLYLARRVGFFDHEHFALRFSLRLLGFWAWLGKEVIRSSLEVVRIILDPRLPISPRVVEIEAQDRHPVYQAILGNSITLTPGTLALDVHEGRILTHSLTRQGARDLVAGEMNRRVAALREQ